jgi:DNA helicase-2/ATP-dependent DNA helicase PcrA
MSDVILNPQQRAAVEHREGPLLIVAGAGTGKTRVIIERVGHLLRTVRGLKPEQILALTFANEAAEEMRQRAAERFGAKARRCRFSTFHAFCYTLLSRQRRSRALDKTDEWIFLRRHLAELDLDYYFKAAEPGRFLADLVDFCSRCHDNLVSPADYTNHVQRCAAECSAAVQRGETPPLGDDEMGRMQEVARVFTTLERLHGEQGLVSFGAMISQAVRLLDASPELLAELQQQYRYILVDEFQDTNTAQFELLVRLAAVHRNVTVVGDDDQAIYRFRGASFASFEQFARRYPDHKRIVLERNYRSTQNILSVAAAAVSRNALNRYLPDKKLVTSKSGPGVEAWEFADEPAQAEHAAAEIARTIKEGRARTYSEFAVLYRAHHHRSRLVTALRRHGIPFSIRNLAINQLPVARDLVAYLRAIGDPQDSISLVRVLADRRWRMRLTKLTDLCREAMHRKRSLWEEIEQGEAARDWEGLESFTSFCKRFRQFAAEDRLKEWYPNLMRELEFPRSAQEREPLKAFAEFVARWDDEKSATGMLQEFLEYYGYFVEAEGVISLTERNEEFVARPVPHSAQMGFWDEPEAGGLGKVQLMTAHAAKGLEFERVIVWHLVRRAFPTTHRRPLIELPPALWKGPLPKGDFHTEEERRLFYVALTRARQELALSTISNPRQRPSPFVDQLQDLTSPELIRKRPVATRAASAAGSLPAASQIGKWALSPVTPRYDELVLSISQLDSYLSCPLKYHFQQNWRIPSPKTPPLLFGSIVHGAVKEIVATVVQNGAGLSQESVAQILERRWPVGAIADPVQERKYRELGMEQLQGIAAAAATGKYTLVHQEKPFEIRAGGCLLRGRIDQIHRLSDGSVELMEYKTGRPVTQREANQSRQVTLYAQASRDVLGLAPQALTIYNLTNQEAVRTARTEADFRDLEKLIAETALEIRAGSFPPQPGYHCRYCPFREICPAQEEAAGSPETLPSLVPSDHRVN